MNIFRDIKIPREVSTSDIQATENKSKPEELWKAIWGFILAMTMFIGFPVVIYFACVYISKSAILHTIVMIIGGGYVLFYAVVAFVLVLLLIYLGFKSLQN